MAIGGTSARQMAAIIAMVAAIALFGQVALNIARDGGLGPALLALYGYFTIWSNTAVVLVCALYARRGPGGHPLTRPQVLAAVAVYIIVVGVIYNTLLIGMNPVSGARWWIDRVFHMAVPAAYPLWWWLATPRRRLEWRHLPVAMAVPVAYCFWSLWRGAVTGRYAYFFIDVTLYGWPRVLANIAGLVILFVGLMAAVIALDRRRTAQPA